MSEHIIDRPHLQPPATRALYGMVTVLLWVAYAYLVLPAATLLAWYFGYSAVYEEMVMRRAWEALVSLIGYYALVVLVMGLTQIAWASINWARFSGKRDRRRLSEGQVDMEIEKMFTMDSVELGAWRKARRLVVHHQVSLPVIVSVEST